jgi:TetR/AcrR family transcriptional regulator
MQVAERRRERRERDAEAARAALLDAAEEVFAECGFSGARVGDIAQAAGYNKALIFHYFGDKLGLYQALVARMKQLNTTRITELLERFFPEGVEPQPERVRAFLTEAIRWSFDNFVRHPQALRMQAWEAAEGWQTYIGCPPAAPASRWPQRVAELLRRAQAAGVLRPEVEPEMLTANVLGMTMQYLMSLPRWRLLFPETDMTSPQALVRAREQIVALVLRGVLAKDVSANHEETWQCG